MAALANMRSLKLLNISNVRLDDAAAEELGGLENLISLRLSATGLRQSGWNWLEKLKGLRELDVSETKNVDNSVVSAIARLRSCKPRFVGNFAHRCRFDCTAEG